MSIYSTKTVLKSHSDINLKSISFKFTDVFKHDGFKILGTSI